MKPTPQDIDARLGLPILGLVWAAAVCSGIMLLARAAISPGPVPFAAPAPNRPRLAITSTVDPGDLPASAPDPQMSAGASTDNAGGAR